MISNAATLLTPVGSIAVHEQAGCIISLDWSGAPSASPTPLLREAIDQLNAYFSGRLTSFSLPLAPQGTPHQQKVWSALRAISHGTTMTYGEIAATVRSSPRAVGTACGKNPIPIIIPCHRVLAAGGHIGGYSGAGGLQTKHFLLTLEGATATS